MADCKACGAWFSSTTGVRELCPACERAKERLNDYLTCVTRCRECVFHDEGENESESWYWCKLLMVDTEADRFCAWGASREEWEQRCQ